MKWLRRLVRWWRGRRIRMVQPGDRLTMTGWMGTREMKVTSINPKTGVVETESDVQRQDH